MRLHRGADRHVGGEDARIAAFSICGIITEPIAEVSATDEPEMPLRNVVATMFTTDSPPRTRTKPTSTLAKRDQAPRHAAFGHDRAGQHEERDGQHRELAHAVGDLQHHRFERNADPQAPASAARPSE